MTEPEFRSLRHDLEAAARQPAFNVITGRRQRRTRRMAAVGAAAVTLVVLAGASLGLRAKAMPDPANTPLPAPTTPTGILPTGAVVPSRNPGAKPNVVSVASDPSGTLFALDLWASMVRFSTDKGVSWKPLMSNINRRGQLAAANANSTWLVTDSEVLYVSKGNWTATPVASPGAFSVAKERLWVVSAGQVQIMTAKQEPKQTTPLPAKVVRVAALSAEAAMVMTLDDQYVAKWYYTFDSGERWTLRPDPCRLSKPDPTGESNESTTMFSAPDRSLWLVCASGPAGGQMLKRMLVSTDDGETWQSRGRVEGSGYATIVSPVSKTQAWRTGSRADVLRTIDGTRWDVVVLNDGGHDYDVAALDGDIAIRLQGVDDDNYIAHLTRDGGRTWTQLVF